MSRLKNGVNKAVAFSASLLMLTGMVSPAAAGWDACCPDPCCPVDCCEMPDYTLYADFIYWQVHPEGLEFARVGGDSESVASALETGGKIYSPDCEFEPGFRVGAIIDLGCCNWDFYAQYTYLSEKFGTTASSSDTDFVHVLIHNNGSGAAESVRGDWDSTFNVLDFGLGRTFEVNCCFDFRPHIGFKATWQELKFTVTADDVQSTTVTNRDVMKFKTDFDGIGLRGGFDAAWRFSPCFSIVGGLALSAVYSDLCGHRDDTHYVITSGSSSDGVKNVDLKVDNCALIPVLELLLGIRWDTRVCDCYDVFVFVGWENQVWWDINRFIYIGNSTANNNYQFGPHGNLTLQGLTVRAGMGF